MLLNAVNFHSIGRWNNNLFESDVSIVCSNFDGVRFRLFSFEVTYLKKKKTKMLKQENTIRSQLVFYSSYFNLETLA